MTTHGRSHVVLPVLMATVLILLCQLVGAGPAQAAPGSFDKSSPSNTATSQPLNVTLAWGTSAGATSYEYCYDATVNSTCTGTWTSVGTSTSALIGPLTPNTTHEWQVRANNGGTTYANGSETAFWTFTTATTALPGAFNKSSPTNLASGQPSTVTLSWGTSTDADGYEYCYDTSNDNACSGWAFNGTSVSKDITGLSPNTTYYWHVRAVNLAGATYSNGSSTAFWSFTTGPSQPGSFNKSAPPDDATGQPLTVTLSWGTSTGATRYEYCYDTSVNNSCSVWTDNGTSTSKEIAGLSPNTTYEWHVRAVNLAGPTYSNGSSTAFWSFTTASAGQPGSFNKSSPANFATSQPLTVTLSWGTSTGATRYEYCYDTSNDNACSGWANNGLSTSVTVGPLSLNTVYYWHVRSVNLVGTTYSNGSSTAFWGFTTGSSQLPGAFNKSSPANGAASQPSSVTLWWGAAANATGYYYCYDTLNNGNCDTGWVSAGTSTSAVIGPLNPNTPYYWHVQALNSWGATYSNGSATAFWSFTTGTSGLPGAFNKSSPANGASGQPSSVTLWWGTSTGAIGYQYCYDTLNNGTCDTGWMSAGTSTSAVIGPLNPSTAYYWHVRAVNASGNTYSNGSASAFWSFTTGTSGLPGAFNKSSPTNGATQQPSTLTLSWGWSSGATSYQYCYDTTNDDFCSGWASTPSTSAAISGLGQNTAYYWHVRAVNASGSTYSNGSASAFWKFTTGSETITTARFRSVAAYDGWVLESSEASGTGGTLNATATTCRVGDDSSDRQFRSILDFDTSSLPNNAVITKAVLRFTPSQTIGSNPFLTHGNLTIDIRSGVFSNAFALQAADFQAPASRSAVGIFGTTPVAGQYRAALQSAGRASINLAGHTQFRLRFTIDDNDDRGDDYLSFFCGNSATRSVRPLLIITYYVP